MSFSFRKIGLVYLLHWFHWLTLKGVAETPVLEPTILALMSNFQQDQEVSFKKETQFWLLKPDSNSQSVKQPANQQTNL